MARKVALLVCTACKLESCLACLMPLSVTCGSGANHGHSQPCCMPVANEKFSSKQLRDVPDSQTCGVSAWAGLHLIERAQSWAMKKALQS